MPTNPYKEINECYKFIDKRFQFIIDEKKPVNKKKLLREILLLFAVSREKIDQFIKEFYLDEQLIIVAGDNYARGKNEQ